MGIYENSKVYGPYKSKLDNRLRVCIVFQNKTKKTVSYPKYLMEIYLNRYLTESETVQHLDGNPLNNDLSNLLVMDRIEHLKMDAKRVEDQILICQWCKKEFLVKGKSLRQRDGKDKKSNSFCSKKCSGIYGTYIQKGNTPFEKVKIERIYYNERDNRNIVNEDLNIGELLTGNADDNTEA